MVFLNSQWSPNISHVSLFIYDSLLGFLQPPVSSLSPPKRGSVNTQLFIFPAEINPINPTMNMQVNIPNTINITNIFLLLFLLLISNLSTIKQWNQFHRGCRSSGITYSYSSSYQCPRPYKKQPKNHI